MWPKLPNMIVARTVTRKINGKLYSVLTSMIDPMRYPSADVGDLYRHRWAIKLGYRRQSNMIGNRFTVISRFPELVNMSCEAYY